MYHYHVINNLFLCIKMLLLNKYCLIALSIIWKQNIIQLKLLMKQNIILRMRIRRLRGALIEPFKRDTHIIQLQAPNRFFLSMIQPTDRLIPRNPIILILILILSLPIDILLLLSGNSLHLPQRSNFRFNILNRIQLLFSNLIYF